MRYILAEPPRIPNDAFDALENAFGSREFSQEEAVRVISDNLDLSYANAMGHIRSLERGGNPTSTFLVAPTVRPPIRPPTEAIVRPPAEEEEDLTVGETPEGPLEL